jgi:hypothetical protein
MGMDPERKKALGILAFIFGFPSACALVSYFITKPKKK